MNTKTNKTLGEMIAELYILVAGLPGTDETGLAGDVREIKVQLKEINGCVKTNTAWRKAFCFIVPALAAAIGFIAGAVFL